MCYFCPSLYKMNMSHHGKTFLYPWEEKIKIFLKTNACLEKIYVIEIQIGSSFWNFQRSQIEETIWNIL